MSKNDFSGLSIGGLSERTRNILVILAMMSAFVVAAWGTIGVPAVKKIAREEIKVLKDNVATNTEHMEDIKFAVNRVILILNKTTDEKIIEAVEKETALFNPAIKRRK